MPQPGCVPRGCGSGFAAHDSGRESELEEFSLSFNDLTGPIPLELADLASLDVLSLSGNSLSGEIPPELGMLQRLSVLQLVYNDLSGAVPWELGSIPGLRILHLSNNPLEGCIRPSLRTVADNDLGGLGLADCPQAGRVPAPGGLGVSLTGGTFTAMWSVVSGASRYELQDRTDGPGGEWTRVGTTTSATLAYSPAGGSECGTTYDFRVRSYGDASTYAAGWSVESEVESVTTDECNSPPEFAMSTYSFMVPEDATTGSTVGTVSATDPNESDTVSYAITVGNAAGKFDVVTSTGAVTVAAALDHETVSSYTLMVEASDGRGGSATTTVEIAVTDVLEVPPAPQSLRATSTASSVTLEWDAPDDVSVTGYQVLRRRPGAGEATLLIYVEDTGDTETTYVDTGVDPGTAHVYRVSAINAAGAGQRSNYVNVTTALASAPAPGGLGVSLTDETFGVTWSAVAGASVYEVRQQVSGSGDGWAPVATTTGLSATYSPVGGTDCGTTYVADWGPPSEPEPYETAACNRPPEFATSTYSFTVAEDATTTDSVGTGSHSTLRRDPKETSTQPSYMLDEPSSSSPRALSTTSILEEPSA